MNGMQRIQPIAATIRHPRGTLHRVRLTHADCQAENFRAEYTHGIFRGATEMVTGDQIIEATTD